MDNIYRWVLVCNNYEGFSTKNKVGIIVGASDTLFQIFFPECCAFHNGYNPGTILYPNNGVTNFKGRHVLNVPRNICSFF